VQARFSGRAEGVIFANELLTMRLTLSALMILGGILVVVLGKRYANQRMVSKA
jgi:hypothetical protein